MHPTNHGMLLTRRMIRASTLALLLVGCPSAYGRPSNAGSGRMLDMGRRPWRARASELLAERLPQTQPPSSTELDYDDAALTALAQNLDLRAARAERGIARAQIVEASILPNVRLSGALDIPTDGATTGSNVGYAAGVSWQVNPLFALRTAIAAGRLEAQAVELGIAWAEWQVAERARLGVVQLTFLRRRLDLARRIADELGAREGSLERSMHEHDVTALELATARSARESACLTALRLAQQRRSARLDWLDTLGLVPTSPMRVVSHPHLPEQRNTPSLANLIRRLPETRLDLIGLRRALEAQDERARVAAINAFPAIELNLGRTLDTSNLGSFGVGVSIELPFLDRNQGHIERARATRERLRETYFARLQAARFEVARAYAERVSVDERLRLVRESIPHLEQLVRRAEEQAARTNLSVVSVYELRLRWLGRQLLEQQLRQRRLELRVALELASGSPLPSRRAGP
ncbi:MAG: TolC family protein [Deltaproteobacteria bacterium]|nr:TolC family protein [Deltaproteobacteria bacterium]